MVIANRGIKGRVVLEVGPVIGCLYVSTHFIDVPVLARRQKSPTGYGL
jgi:hypothetical protein